MSNVFWALLEWIIIIGFLILATGTSIGLVLFIAQILAKISGMEE